MKNIIENKKMKKRFNTLISLSFNDVILNIKNEKKS